MKKLFCAIIFVSVILCFSSCSEKAEFTVEIDEEMYEKYISDGSTDFALDSNTAVKAARKLAWNEYVQNERKDESRINEVTSKAITYVNENGEERTMRYEMYVIGKAGSNGYPLYICLHGGGHSDTPDINDSQWEMMTYYYRDSVKNGIYVATRGIEDTWDTHFRPESFPLYERLIADITLFYGVDTNQVYLVGYSAGGDGVYQITPRLADRFAAANMSAGHPNGVNLTNIYNVPFQIQCGENDSACGRNDATKEYANVLSELQSEYGGFIHNVNIHRGQAHKIYDNDPAKTVQVVIENPVRVYYGEKAKSTYRDTNAISFLEQYTRNPVPKRVVWDLSVRADLSTSDSFYWLRADKSINEGQIIASYDTESNTITVEKCTVKGKITVLLDERIVDLFKPVKVIFNGTETEYTVEPSWDVINGTLCERSDSNYVFAASIVLSFD